MVETRLTINAVQPHAKQREILDHPAKRKVVVCGRRVGKTTMAAYAASMAFLAGKRVLYAAPKLDQTEAFWRDVVATFESAITAGVIYKNLTKKLISLNGTRSFIRAKTAHDANTLRSDAADILILDEFALMDLTAWSEVGAPMMLDTDGEAWFLFTPKGKNHAYKMYIRGMADESGRWASWNFSSHENPFLSPKALEEITQDMTKQAYQQEIMAMFLENEGQVFRNIPANLHAPSGATPADHKGHRIVIGCDWGKQNDFTVFSVGCATCSCEVLLYRSNKVDYATQSAKLKLISDSWATVSILPESNSIGEPIIEQLVRMGLPIHYENGKPGFWTSATSKPPLIENMKLSLERTEFQFLDVPIATAEMESFEQAISRQTGRSSYGAPTGMHDDTVIARALMLKIAASSWW